jgi:aspartate/methionine/tyrosine aminotransferase
MFSRERRRRVRFEKMDYLDWARTKSKVRINLCLSGMRNLSLKNLGIDRDKLEIYGDNMYGYPPLLEAIASRFKVREENVVTAIGTSHAIFLVCAALLQAGDEVLIEKPAYEPLLAVPGALETVISRIERKYENKYQIDLDEFDRLISQKTKLVILTNLHNPSGTFLKRSTLKDMAEIAQKKGVWLLVDEIYLDYMEEEEERETSFSLAENIIVISSLTKVYGLGGLRCGWILAPSKIVKKMRSIIDYTSVEGVFIGEQISAGVFSQLDSILEKNKELVKQNSMMMRNFIQKEEKLSWVEPAAGILCFPKVEGLTGDRLASLLLEKYKTSVVPGRFFEDSQHIRIGIGVPSGILARGLENIKKALEEL